MSGSVAGTAGTAAARAAGPGVAARAGGAPDAAAGPLADRHHPRRATRCPAALEPFNLAGVLDPTDVHAAATLCRLAGDERPDVMLGAALAVRAPRHGHVCVELGRVAGTVTPTEGAPVGVDELDWPDAEAWREALRSSPLVSVRPPGTPEIDPSQDRPLSLVGQRLYLDRYWRYERRVAEVLRARAARVRGGVDLPALRRALDRLLPPSGERPDRQRLAVATGVLRGLAVIAGGPGTGKTHTVARLLALLHELAPEGRPRIAVAAPTGKAADRLTAAVRDAAADLETTDAVRGRLRALEASTLHRLLGYRPGSSTRFYHDRSRKLPHEVVVVDETSMVSLPLMAKLVVALRPATQLVLVGDPDQLESVEAGAVLGDIAGPAGDRLRTSPQMRDLLERATGEPLAAAQAARDGGIDDAVVVLSAARRFRAGSGIERLATAIHAGDADAAVAALRAGSRDVVWLDPSGAAAGTAGLDEVRAAVVDSYRPVHAACAAGDGRRALDALDRARVLCAHRHGPVGVSGWVSRIERWLAQAVKGYDPTARWHVGRPVLVTRNDPRLRLFNGDVGVTIRAGDGLKVAFRGAQEVRLFGTSRLEDVETVHAMTIHKSQGSQFEHVVVVLPEETSPILTRELLYTAVTRASQQVTVLGPEATVRRAIARRVARASGLRATLWGPHADRGPGP